MRVRARLDRLEKGISERGTFLSLLLSASEDGQRAFWEERDHNERVSVLMLIAGEDSSPFVIEQLRGTAGDESVDATYRKMRKFAFAPAHRERISEILNEGTSNESA